MYLAKNNTLLKRTYVAYVSMATKYPFIKIVICANYENIGHKLLGPLKEGGGGGGLVLCAMYKIHLLAMCYVSFCSHCYVKIKWGAMQKYNLCYVLCK